MEISASELVIFFYCGHCQRYHLRLNQVSRIGQMNWFVTVNRVLLQDTSVPVPLGGTISQPILKARNSLVFKAHPCSKPSLKSPTWLRPSRHFSVPLQFKASVIQGTSPATLTSATEGIKKQPRNG